MAATLSCHSSSRDNRVHKAVDLVCDDYNVINAPFSGSLAGPVSQKDPTGHQYDGVKLLSDGKKRKVSVQCQRNLWKLTVVAEILSCGPVNRTYQLFANPVLSVR